MDSRYTANADQNDMAAQELLLELLLAEEGIIAPPLQPIKARQRGTEAPLSFAQQRLWFLDQIEPGNPFYNLSSACRLIGQLDVSALEQSLNALVARHETLRTSIHTRNGTPLQRISAQISLPLKVIDLQDLNEESQSCCIQNVLSEQVRHVFDLTSPPLMRASLLKLNEHHHIFVTVSHHIVSDGWSSGIFLRELATLYAAFIEQKPSPLPELALQYADFAIWQRDYLQGEVLKQQRDYWKEQLAGAPALLELPYDRKRPPQQSYQGQRYTFTIPNTLVSGLNRLSQRYDVTLFMTLLSAFNVLLSRYTNESDIVVGSPIANRNRGEIEGLIGFFINTLVLRTSMAGNLSFAELLGRVREVTLGAYAHQDLPFEKLVEIIQPSRNLSYHPLFQVMLILHNAARPVLENERLSMYPLDISTGTSQFDLTLFFVENSEGLSGAIEYSTDLFDHQSITRLVEHLLLIFSSVVEKPDQKIAAITFLTAEEQGLLLSDGQRQPGSGNRADEEYIHDLFAAQARRTPAARALVFEQTGVTYAELHQQVVQLAAYLRQQGVGAETLVGVYMERSVELVIGLLAILQAGGAYVPLDPGYPRERLAFMIEETGMPVILTRQCLMEDLPASQAQLICLDKLPKIAASQEMQPVSLTPDNIAYMIYTSGSTGRPKGVMVSHRNLTNFLIAMDETFSSEQAGTWLAVTSISFDISILELFWTLCNGYQVILQSEQDKLGYLGRTNAIGEHATKTIAFSLFYFASNDNISQAATYRLLIESARYADEHGFSAVWTPERHFHAFGGLYPNPSVMGAALATITSRIAIRAGSVVLPLHNPVRVAEEWSLVDNLSHGRVGVSFASGWHAHDFVLAPDNYHQRKNLMLQGIETIRRLWHGESISLTGGTGKETSISIMPHPVQRELPIWITAAGNPETFKLAGELGANLLTHLLGQDLDELKIKIALYRQALRDHGHPAGTGKVTVMLHTFVGEDLETVHQMVRQPMCQYLRSSLDLLANLAQEFGKNVNDEDFTPQDLDDLVEFAFERYFQTSGLFGTPAMCEARVEQLRAIDVDEIACLIDFGVEHASVMQSLDLLNQVRSASSQAQPISQPDYALPAQIIRHHVTHLQCTPSLAAILVSDPSARQALGRLKHLLLGGEALPASLLAELSNVVQGEIHNMYGPTETTIWSTTTSITSGAAQIHIGYPIRNTRLSILDANLQPVPIGVAGELHIGGAGVTRGYFHHPELVAEKYIPDHLSAEVGARLYKTGDLVRYRHNGTIEYLNRVDQQVKFHGYRIELTEIESILCQYPGVRESAVIIREDIPGDKRLVAYFTWDKAATPSLQSQEMYTFLQERLPVYMLPSALVYQEVLPLTPNGKLNRRALPAPESGRIDTASAYREASTPLEEMLVTIWRQVLRVEKIGITDNFFRLGGDSILTIQLVSRLNQAGLPVTAKQVFQHQTIAELSTVITPSQKIEAEPGPASGEIRFTPIQHWFFAQNLSVPQHYNQSLLLELHQPFDAALLREAFEHLLQHHDALRLRFWQEATIWHAAYTDINAGERSDDLCIERDLSGLAEGEQQALIESESNRLQARLNLQAGRLLRAIHFKLGNRAADRLCIVIHHLVVDGISWRILLEDLYSVYQQLSQKQPILLSARTTSFQKWNLLLHAHAQSERLRSEAQHYWLREFRQEIEKVPQDSPDGYNLESSARNHWLLFSKEETSALLYEVPHAYHTQIDEVLLTALTQAYTAWCGQTRLLVDLEGHGREAIIEGADIGHTVGWFTSLFPVILALPEDNDPGTTLKALKEHLRAVPHQGIGYGLLRYLAEDLVIKEQMASLPQAQIIFNYLGQFAQGLPGQATPPFTLVHRAEGKTHDPTATRAYLLDINGAIHDGQLEMSWTYSQDIFTQASIARLADLFSQALRALIKHCQSYEASGYSPADFPLLNIEQRQLDSLIEQVIGGQQGQVHERKRLLNQIEDIYPLSPLQMGMLFHHLYAPEAGLYFQQLGYVLEGELNIPAFVQSWRGTVERHPVLRSAFYWQELDSPLQIVCRSAELPLEQLDWQGISQKEQSARLTAYLKADQLRGFQFEHAPLMRLTIIRCAPDLHHCIWSYSHLILDGWCLPILLKEVFQSYKARLAGVPAVIPRHRPYRDYIAWLQEQDHAKAEAFWRQMLRGYAVPSPLVLEEPAAGAIDIDPAKTATGPTHEEHTSKLTAEASARLEHFTRTHQFTLNTLIAGAWAILLSRSNGANDLVFGMVHAGRSCDLSGAESMIGLFINTLPARIQLPPAAFLLTWLQELQAQFLETRQYEHTPLSHIINWSEVPRNQALFETLLIFENYPVEQEHEGPLTIRESYFFERTNYPLTILVTPGQQLRLKISSDPARFSSSTSKQLLESLQALIERMAMTDAQSRLADYLVPVARVGVTASSPLSPVQRAEPLPPEAEEARRSNGPSRLAAVNATEALLRNIWEQVFHVKGIGVQDNFFALGGDSLMSMQIVGKANQLGLPLTLRQLLREQTITNVAARLAREKLQPTEPHTLHKTAQSSTPEQKTREQREESSQLSTAGERLLASESGSTLQLTPDSTHIHLPFPLTDVQHAYWMGRDGIFELGNVATHIYIEVESVSLDLARFNRAWQRLIERHDMLRCIILPDGRQQILERVEAYQITVADFRGWNSESAAQALESIRQFMSHQILPTDQWPLFEIRASQLEQQRTRLHLSIDYLIVDAWSLQILFRELVQLYRHPTEELIPLTISFRDYVLALKEANIYKRAEEYWWKRLEDLPPAPELPLTKSPSTITRPRFVRRGGRLDPATWQRLKYRASQQGITASSILLAAFAEILAVWSKSPRFTINLTLFNRLPVHPQIDSLVGDFTSLTLLAVDHTQASPYHPDDSFTARALRIQQQLWEDLDHRNTSGVRVLRELARRQGGAQQASMPVVFTSTIGMSNSAETLTLLNEMFEEVYSIGQTPQVWLDHQVSEQAGGLRFSWDAVEELFPEGYIQSMFQAYLDLLQRLADENQDWPTFADELLPAEQLEQRANINATTTPLPEHLLLQSLFERQTRTQPEQIAIISASRTLTYRQVYNRARYLSYQLQEQTTIQPNTLVGIVMEKGWEQIVAALGILQAGAAYVSIDAGLPAERIAFLLEHGNIQIVLTQSWIDEKGLCPAHITRICVDQAGEIDGSSENYHSQPGQQPSDLAYVIYTSGSTGQPKGVMIDHRGALNTILDLNQRFHVGPQDRVLAISSLSFDLSVYDIFGLLAAGGSLVLPEATASRDPERWLTLINQHKVTIWNTVPTLLQMLVDGTDKRENIALPTLRLALLSGDWIPVTLPDRCRQLAPQAEMISLGGATEASIWSILYPITEVSPGQTSIPYGKPMLNQTFHVLNQNLQPCPVWVPGKLYIGGIGLARGYWRDAEKTRQQFIQHPLTGERLYSTGDLGRYLPDGNIEFLGREDFQVKIRGHRIELGEIEATLNQHPDVQASVVLALGEKQGPKRLVGYIVAANESAPVLPENDLLFLNPSLWEKWVAAGTRQSQLELVEIDPQLARVDLQHFLSISDQLSNFVERFVNGYICLALRKLGIFTQANERHTIAELIERYAILPRYSKWLYRCLLMLVNEDLLIRDDQIFSNRAPLPAQDVDALWSEIKNELPGVELDFLRGQLDAFRLNGERLVSVLTGAIHAVEFLFPEGDPSQAEYMYQTTFHHCNSIISSLLAEVIATLPAEGPPLRILEIGAGVGGTTASVLPILSAHSTTYVYTDISRYFMPIGRKNFGNYPFVEYAVLDIEKDPQSQGYEAGSFDIILAASVLHATRDVQETLQHVRSLLKSNGLLFMVEETHFHHMFNLSMGLQQGFDHFEDIHLRPLHPLLSAQEWQQLILAQGFDSFAVFNKPGSLSAFLGLEVILAQASLTPQVHNLKSILHGFLKEKLPDYMLPSNLLILAALPLTANGKVDRQKLKELAQAEQWRGEKASIAPRNELEKSVVVIWQQLLELDQISMDENFFALGGDSLIATRLITQLRETFQVEIPVRSLFEAPTVAELATAIDQLRQRASRLDKPALHPLTPREAYLPLSFAQQRLWFLDQLTPNSHFYNIPVGVHLTGVLDHTALEKSLQHLIQRHETLRTTFTQVEQKPVQQIAETVEVGIPIVDLTTWSGTEEQQKLVQTVSREEASRPFDLCHGPLLRFQLLRLTEYDHVLLTNMHHIVSDGWSMGVLIQELATLYKGFASGRQVRLPALPIQYADFASLEREWFQGQLLEKHLDYWRQRLAGIPPLLQLPTDHPRPEIQSYQGAILTHTLPQALVNQLELRCRQQELTLFMLLLAAFNVLLRYYSGQEKIVVGTDIANRPYKETEHLIGFFVNQLVLFIDFSRVTTFAELLDQVREVTLGAYEHQELPFNKLVEALSPERTLQYEPLFQVKLVLQNVPAPNVKVPGLSIKPFEIERGTTQLDLHIRAEERPAGLTLTAEYSTDLFEAATIARWLRHLEMLLQEVGNAPHIGIEALNALLVQADRQEQMKNWPDKRTLNPRDLKTARRRKVVKQEHEMQRDNDQDA